MTTQSKHPLTNNGSALSRREFVGRFVGAGALAAGHDRPAAACRQATVASGTARPHDRPRRARPAGLVRGHQHIGIVGRCVAVDGHAERRTDLVLPPVPPADRPLVVIEDVEVRLQFAVIVRRWDQHRAERGGERQPDGGQRPIGVVLWGRVSAEVEARLEDDSSMGGDFPSDGSGKYDLRLKLRAKAK